MGKTTRATKRAVPNGRQKTRSHGATLLTPSDPAKTERELASQLRTMGLYPSHTKGDGNCLFRALSDQLYGHDREHLSLRRQICDHLITNPERYEFFVDDGRPFADHVRVMRANGTYGGHLELTAFAHLKQRWVKVIQPGLVYVVSCEDEGSSSTGATTRKGKRPAVDSDDEDEDPGAGSTIYLAYHSWEHWSSVRNVNGPHAGPPCVRELPRSSHASSPSLTPPPASSTPSQYESLILHAVPPDTISLDDLRTLVADMELVGDDVHWERMVEILIEREAGSVDAFPGGGDSSPRRKNHLGRHSHLEASQDWRSASPLSSSDGGSAGPSAATTRAANLPSALALSEPLSRNNSDSSLSLPMASQPSSTASSSSSSLSTPYSAPSDRDSLSPPPPTPPSVVHDGKPQPPRAESPLRQGPKLRFKRPPPQSAAPSFTSSPSQPKPPSPQPLIKPPAGKEKRAARKRRVEEARATRSATVAANNAAVATRTRRRLDEGGSSGGGRTSDTSATVPPRVEGGFRELYI